MHNEHMRQRYAEGRVPWDAPTPPPEVTAAAQTLPAGRGLDLGCGYGRSSIYLARQGWQMDGVDYVPQAVEGAIARAAAANVAERIQFHVGDVTRLDFLAPAYDLILDIGCMHSFPDDDLPRYRDGVARLLREGGTYLLYAKIHNPDDDHGPRGVEETAVYSLFQSQFTLTRVERGQTQVEDRPTWESAWFWFTKTARSQPFEKSLTSEVAIVTGAGRGIGAAIAEALTAVGVKIAVNDINPDRAAQTAKRLQEMGGTAVAIPADVSNKFQCSHLVDETRRRLGSVDILINNAAVKPSSSILKTDEFEWQRTLDVNLKGTFFMSQLCGRVMADNGGGAIVNIASTAGVETPMPLHAAYAASKAAVAGFTRECAREYAEYDIRVHLLTPPEPVEATAVAKQVLALIADS